MNVGTAYCQQKPKRSDIFDSAPNLYVHSTSTTKIFSVYNNGINTNNTEDKVGWSNSPIDVDVHIYMLYNKIIEQQGTKLRVLDMN